jgi:hypothetical protein
LVLILASPPAPSPKREGRKDFYEVDGCFYVFGYYFKPHPLPPLLKERGGRIFMRFVRNFYVFFFVSQNYKHSYSKYLHHSKGSSPLLQERGQGVRR